MRGRCPSDHGPPFNGLLRQQPVRGVEEIEARDRCGRHVAKEIFYPRNVRLYSRRNFFQPRKIFGPQIEWGDEIATKKHLLPEEVVTGRKGGERAGNASGKEIHELLAANSP